MVLVFGLGNVYFFPSLSKGDLITKHEGTYPDDEANNCEFPEIN